MSAYCLTGAALSSIAMQMCGVSCGFQFRPTLGLTLGLKQWISQHLLANEAAGHPLVNGKKRKNIMAFRKRRHCRGPHALEVINLNAVASNLPRTCFKSKSLPNSVIFITELQPSTAAQIQENPFEPNGRFERREVPIIFGSQKLHT